MAQAGLALTNFEEAAAKAEARCREQLQSILDQHPGILGAVIAWVDGRTFTHAFRSGHEVEAARVAAVSSSLLALSESFSGETLGDKARYSSIVTDRGCIITARVPAGVPVHVLCLWVDGTENHAMALHYALETVQKLASIEISPT